MTARAAIQPQLLAWACERAGMQYADLEHKFPKIQEWVRGQTQPTLKQIDDFAKAVHVPVGFLFLPTPPTENVPIPDFRTFNGESVERPSPNLLDTVYACQERQAWYREYAQVSRQPALTFVGSAGLNDSPEQVASEMRRVLNFNLEERRSCPSWTEALRLFLNQVDSVGILIMVNSVVLNNTSRHLDVNEFRGFALADSLAPLIFINAADTKAGQMFTLAHELAHLWLGATALSNVSTRPVNGHRPEEIWCNAVAAEFLVPLSVLRTELRQETTDQAITRLSRVFKVSTLVILRRLLDAGWLNRSDFDNAWSAENARLQEVTTGSGGDFYRTTAIRFSGQFTRALITSTLEGQTLYRDAFRMLGISKTETFENIGRQLGVLA